MRKADFRKEGILNEANINLVFEKNDEIIYDLLKIEKVSDFIEVFDKDRDGFLSEDEQISIFILIKEKMQIVAQELNNVYEYSLYKEMMKEVRQIESDIVGYQDQLR